MSTKSYNIEQTGTVIEVNANSIFKVELDNIPDSRIICTISGKMRMNNIRLIVGDRVKLEMSPYDLTKGRITYRIK